MNFKKLDKCEICKSLITQVTNLHETLKKLTKSKDKFNSILEKN